ncbi:MAG: NYN domain-containing protein [Sedimentisphaerales bacterium]|nr:NYN domain-containing protein [Sedimentisphaerales bacterium]
MRRTIAYIDGFNLYFGLKSKGWRKYYWLNIQLLIQNLLKSDQRLILTKYFTSLISSPRHDQNKSRRQLTYLEALQTLPDFEIIYGHYLIKRQSCNSCRANWTSHEEKMTDVNIAVELLTDAFQDKFDTAFLISGDSDLSSPIERVRELFPQKRIVIAFPPERESAHLKKLTNAYFTIGRRNIAKSLFPEEIKKKDGFVLKRPKQWQQ